MIRVSDSDFGLFVIGNPAFSYWSYISAISAMSLSASSIIRSCRKLVCVGRNYAEHARELNNAVPTSPILFLKPSTSLISQPAPILIPSHLPELHHEVELGIIIKKTGSNIHKSNVQSHIGAYILALDMTSRIEQEKAKKAGLPWSIAKGADTYGPISNGVEPNRITDLKNTEIWLKVNGVEKQRGNSKDMIFPIDELISYISSIFTLEAGDIILTGTPSGVSGVKAGDVITAGVTGVKELDVQFRVEQKPKANL